MSARAHTPGPWLVEDPMGSGPGDHVWIVQEGATSEVFDWRNLAVVCSDDPDDKDTVHPISVAERDANARLIAAAPTILEALEEACDQLGLLAKDPETNPWLQQGRAAIAQAKGGAA